MLLVTFPKNRGVKVFMVLERSVKIIILLFEMFNFIWYDHESYTTIVHDFIVHDVIVHNYFSK